MRHLRRIGLVAPALAAGAALAPPEAQAEVVDAESRSSLSYNLYLVSDYRGRGVSYSDNEAALQGGADYANAEGWSVGVWASTFPDEVDADVEIDVYAAKTFAIGPAELAIGAGAYFFPGAEDWDFGEAQASLSMPIGPFDATLAANYAWEQDNLGGEDDFYISASAATPVGRFLGAPLTFSASFGYEEGFFVVEDAKTDWSLGLTAEIGGAELAVSYVDTNIDADTGEGGWVISIGRTF